MRQLGSINSEEQNEQRPVYLYKIFVALAWASILLGMIYSRFTEETMEEGFGILGVSASNTLTVFSSILASIQFFSNVLGIRPKSDSKRVLNLDDNLNVRKTSESNETDIKSLVPVNKAGKCCSYPLMAITFATGAVATALPLNQFLKVYPYLNYPVIALIVSANSIYFVLLSKKDVDNTQLRIKNKDPALFSLFEKAKLLFIEAGIKITITTFYRGAMHAYIGDAFFKKIVNLDNALTSIIARSVCGFSAAAVALLTRAFPLLDNYYQPMKQITPQQREEYLANMTWKEKILYRAKAVPLPLFRCGYPYVLGSIIYRNLENSGFSTIGRLGISAAAVIPLGACLILTSYFAGCKHELNRKIMAPISTVSMDDKRGAISADNKIVKALSIFINLTSQFTWGIVGVSFINNVLKGIMSENEIIAAAASVGAEIGYTTYFYMGPKIHQGLIASLNTCGQFCQRRLSARNDEQPYQLLINSQP
jgi:hypothetical protein